MIENETTPQVSALVKLLRRAHEKGDEKKATQVVRQLYDQLGGHLVIQAAALEIVSSFPYLPPPTPDPAIQALRKPLVDVEARKCMRRYKSLETYFSSIDRDHFVRLVQELWLKRCAEMKTHPSFFIATSLLEEEINRRCSIASLELLLEFARIKDMSEAEVHAFVSEPNNKIELTAAEVERLLSRASRIVYQSFDDPNGFDRRKADAEVGGTGVG
jgi:hypothetical protein